jgi:hypothetical protein
MKRKPFILLLTMIAASRAATDETLMASLWVWMLILSLCAVIGVVLCLALCKAAAVSDAWEEGTYEAMLKQSRIAAAAAAAAVVAVAARSRTKRPAIGANAE